MAKQSRRRDISIDFEGTVYLATYTVESDVVTVTWIDDNGSPWTESRVTKADREFEARSVFSDILSATKKRGQLKRS